MLSLHTTLIYCTNLFRGCFETLCAAGSTFASPSGTQVNLYFLHFPIWQNGGSRVKIYIYIFFLNGHVVCLAFCNAQYLHVADNVAHNLPGENPVNWRSHCPNSSKCSGYSLAFQCNASRQIWTNSKVQNKIYYQPSIPKVKFTPQNMLIIRFITYNGESWSFRWALLIMLTS